MIRNAKYWQTFSPPVLAKYMYMGLSTESQEYSNFRKVSV